MRRALPALLLLLTAVATRPADGAGRRPAGERAETPAPTPAGPDAIPELTPSPTPTPLPTPPPGRIQGKVMVDGKDGQQPGEGAVVFLERVDPETWPPGKRAPDVKPAITMKDKRFEPRALPVLVDREVNFPNLDPIYHNVFSLSAKNKFDLGLYKDGKSKDHTFQTPGVVRLFCNIHPSMTGFVLVMQNPWWESVRADGTYKLADVPPGSYTLKVWHEKGGESAREVVVEAGKTVKADFTLDASKYKVVPHKNKFGQDYSKDGY